MSACGLLGFDKQFAQHVVAMQLAAVVVNGTSTHYVLTVPTGFGSIRIAAVQWVASAVLNDVDGSILVTVTARDVSEGADDVLVNAQSVEGGTAHVPADFALAAEGAEKEFTLDEGDSLRVAVVNNTASIDTNGSLSVLVYYHSVPRDTAGDDLKHASFYKA